MGKQTGKQVVRKTGKKETRDEAYAVDFSVKVGRLPDGSVLGHGSETIQKRVKPVKGIVETPSRIAVLANSRGLEPSTIKMLLDADAADKKKKDGEVVSPRHRTVDETETDFFLKRMRGYGAPLTPEKKKQKGGEEEKK